MRPINEKNNFYIWYILFTHNMAFVWYWKGFSQDKVLNIVMLKLKFFWQNYNSTMVTDAFIPGIAWGGDYWTNFLHSIIFPIFHYCQNTGYLLNITFIFDRGHHSSAVVTPVKSKSDSYNVIGTFARKLSLRRNQQTLVTPTPVIAYAG